jgi:cytoskeleton protein RodZ
VNPTQQEQLLNIGAYLRDIRQEKGKQIDEVANQIFIRPALVKAIETGDWESLPEPVFVQGFIRRYAEYLGLNGRELSEKFEPTPVAVLPNPELANSSSVEGVVKPEDKHGLKVLSKAEPTHNGATVVPTTSASNRLGVWLIGLGAIAVLVGLIGWLTTRNTPQLANAPSTPTVSETEDDDPTGAESDVATSDSPTAGSGLADTAEAPDELATASGAPITFAVDIEDDAWMRVTADGEKVYEGILTAGTQEAWTANNELRITAGNSGGVLYSFNGSDEQPLGAPGAVANLTLTPDMDPDELSTP